MRKLIAGLLLLALPLLAACGSDAPAATTQPVLKSGLTWTGTEITGLKYYVRETERARVHYALPSVPDTAEVAANSAAAFYASQAKMGRLPLASQVDIWILPPLYAWPEGAPSTTGGALAVAPGVIIVQDAAARLRVEGNATTPLLFSLAAAAYEPAGSPIYAQEWLQFGMGSIRLQDWNFFPQQFWRMGRQQPQQGTNLLADAAASGSSNQWFARIILASAIFDRFGMGWSEQYTGDPVALTPEAALKWAMGTDNPSQALERWDLRVRSAINAVGTLPDIRPERMAPELAQLPPGPGPNPNYSPQTYEIDATLDAAQGTVSGDMRLTWQNGESIPLDALYFNLWANAERHRMYGGSTRVDSVTVDGKPATFVAKGIDLKVDLGRQVAPGEQVEVAVTFSTHLTGNLNFGLGISQSQGFILSHFYPILAVLDDRGWNLHALSSAGGNAYSEHASYKVSLTVPAGYQVGGAGRAVARTEGDKTWTYRYEASQLPHWSAAGGKAFTESKVTVGSTTVQLLGALPSWHEQMKPAVTEILGFLQQELGPSPIPDLVVVQGSAKLPGIASAGDIDAAGTFKLRLANNLAGQWFGAHVGNDQWTEAWLDEGLSRYMEWEAARALKLRLFGVRLLDRPRDARITQNGMTFLHSRNWDLMARDYAGLFFEALEDRIGSAAMNGLLRQWIGEYGGRTGTGADLIRLAEGVAGPLGPLLQEHAVDVNDRQPYRPIPVPGYN
jgi:hypothetical protein